MKINQLWIMAMAVCTLLLSTSCSNDDDSPEVKNYKLDQINPLVNFGKTVQELQAIAVGKTVQPHTMRVHAYSVSHKTTIRWWQKPITTLTWKDIIKLQSPR